jgi:hypothetical protein
MYSFTCIPNILNSISALLFLYILCFTFYHGIRASTVSLFTQSGEQPDPQQHRAYTVHNSIGREILHKVWREIRSPLSAQKIVAESTHEEEERNMLKILRSQSYRRHKRLKISRNSFKFVKDCCKRQKRLKNSENSHKLVKDCCKRKKDLKNS